MVRLTVCGIDFMLCGKKSPHQGEQLMISICFKWFILNEREILWQKPRYFLPCLLFAWPGP